MLSVLVFLRSFVSLCVVPFRFSPSYYCGILLLSYCAALIPKKNKTKKNYSTISSPGFGLFLLFFSRSSSSGFCFCPLWFRFDFFAGFGFGLTHVSLLHRASKGPALCLPVSVLVRWAFETCCCPTDLVLQKQRKLLI